MLRDLTQEQVKSLFTYDPEEGLLRWKYPAGQGGRIPPGSVAGRLHPEGYRYVTVNGRHYRGSRIIWLWMTGEWPMHQIDHINRNTSDDRWINLRAATPSQNKKNNGIRKDSSTGYKCVTFDKDRNCYTVRVTHGGRRLRLGRFKTAEEAHEAYKAKIAELHGEFANPGVN